MGGCSMSTSPPTGTPLAPEQYRKILEGLSLESIHLAQCIAEIDHHLFQAESLQNTPLRVGVHQEVTRWEQQGDVLTFWHTYQLKGKLKRKQALRIEAVYLIRYRTQQPVSEEFVHIFQQSTLILTTYPYFRELVDSTMRRMGVPPLTLPMVLVR